MIVYFDEIFEAYVETFMCNNINSEDYSCYVNLEIYSQKPKQHGNNINLGSNNTYISGKIVIINNITDITSKSIKVNQSSNNRYNAIKMYLNNMSKEDKHRVIIDIEHMLEKEYGFTRVMNKQSDELHYSRIVEYLDSLDERQRRHAIVDVEYILEEYQNG